jgi:hypothetical protein
MIPSTAIPTPGVRCFIPYPDKSLPERVDYELKRATAVFSGKVIAKVYQPVKNPAEHPAGSEELITKIAVDRWWKGEGREEIEMHNGEIKYPNGVVLLPIPENNYPFEVEKAYLVYAFSEAYRLQPSACSLTQPLEQAAEQLRILGEGKLPGK